MPEYNAIQTSRLESWLKRLLGTRNGGIMPTVAPELGAAVNLPMYQDTDLLADYRAWGTGIVVNAVAGQNALLDVSNLSAGWLLLVRPIVTPGGATFIYEMTGASIGGALIPAANAGWRDTRLLASSFPLNATGIQVRSGTAALAGIPPGAQNVVSIGAALAQTPCYFPWVTLAPGGVLSLACNVQNLQVAFAIEGYLRAVDPDELNVE